MNHDKSSLSWRTKTLQWLYKLPVWISYRCNNPDILPLIARVSFAAARWKSSFDYLFCSPYFSKSSWLSCCGGCIWSVRFVVQMLTDSSSHSCHKPAKSGDKITPSCLSASSFSAVLQKHLNGAQDVPEAGPAGLRMQVSGEELLQHYQKHQIHFCVTSN